MGGQVTTTTLDIFCTLAREAGFFGVQDGRALVNFRVLSQLIKA